MTPLQEAQQRLIRLRADLSAMKEERKTLHLESEGYQAQHARFMEACQAQIRTILLTHPELDT